MNFRKHLSEPWTSVTKKSLVLTNAQHSNGGGLKPHGDAGGPGGGAGGGAGASVPEPMRESTTSLSASGSSYHCTFSPTLDLIFHLKLFGASSIIFFSFVTLSLAR